MRIPDNIVKLLKLVGFESKLALFSGECHLGGETHNDLLSKYGGQYGHTDIILHMVYHLCDTAVLRFSFL